MILLDAHVHIYDCFDLDQFFNVALSNFQKAAKRFGSERKFSFFLLLSETPNENWFERLYALAAPKNQPGKKLLKKWTIHPTAEGISLALHSSNNFFENRIIVVAGRQIVTAEKVEVLSLLSDAKIDGEQSLRATVNSITKEDGLPVIPWGAGKWIGKRGRILKDFVRSNTEKDLFISDTGSRPKIWPTPLVVRHAQARGFRILGGSDPLPLPSDMSRVGNFGAHLDCNCTDHNPAACLKKMLKDGSKKRHIGLYGELQRTFPFIAKQLRIAMRRGNLTDL